MTVMNLLICLFDYGLLRSYVYNCLLNLWVLWYAFMDTAATGTAWSYRTLWRFLKAGLVVEMSTDQHFGYPGCCFIYKALHITLMTLIIGQGNH